LPAGHALTGSARCKPVEIGLSVFAMKMTAIAKLEANAPDIARMLRVFANERRVRILCRLAASKEELSIAALAEGIQISQSALSQHLMKLRKGGLVVARRAGKMPSIGLPIPVRRSWRLLYKIFCRFRKSDAFTRLPLALSFVEHF
jgi:DNA-binding transcriptional ArsR family regulator